MFEEHELAQDAVIRNFRITAADGKANNNLQILFTMPDIKHPTAHTISFR